jgi:hypothetical protein
MCLPDQLRGGGCEIITGQGRKTMITNRKRRDGFQMTRTPSEIMEEFDALIDEDLIRKKDMMALVVGFETETSLFSIMNPTN